jgi:long-chain acyl-CoA synthetase
VSRSLAAALDATAREHADQPALVAGGTAIDHATLGDRIARGAAALAARGVGPDDAVAVHLPTTPAFAVATHAAIRAGGVAVPLDPRSEPPELAAAVAASGATLAVTTADLAPGLEAASADPVVVDPVTAGGDDGPLAGAKRAPLPERAPDDTAVEALTSGTTGAPKRVRLSHENLRSNAAAMVERLGLSPTDRVLGVLPLSHSFGLTVALHATLLAGASLHTRPRWEPAEAAALAEREALTVAHGVPTIYHDLAGIDGGYDLSTLRFCVSGGAALPLALARRFEARYDTRLVEGYGLTEAAPVVACTDPGGERRLGSVGTPLRDVTVRIVDGAFADLAPVRHDDGEPTRDEIEAATGEVVVAGPNVMAGYDDPAATAAAITEADGRRWLHTGDAGYRDADGYLVVRDRLADVIDTGGRSVHPSAVETAVTDHPAVADCAVLGRPDERLGEVVVAVVVPVADGSAPDAAALDAFLDGRLAAHRRPTEVRVADTLPRTASGTVRRDELADRFDGLAPAGE